MPVISPQWHIPCVPTFAGRETKNRQSWTKQKKPRSLPPALARGPILAPHAEGETSEQEREAPSRGVGRDATQVRSIPCAPGHHGAQGHTGPAHRSSNSAMIPGHREAHGAIGKQDPHLVLGEVGECSLGKRTYEQTPSLAILIM